MSIFTASFHSLYNKLPSLSPSSLANATASTASSTYNLVKDGFYSTIGKLPEYGSQAARSTASTAGAHPYLTIMGILGAAATGLIYSGRRPAMETVKETVYQGARKLKLMRELTPKEIRAAKRAKEKLEREAKLKLEREAKRAKLIHKAQLIEASNNMKEFAGRVYSGIHGEEAWQYKLELRENWRKKVKSAMQKLDVEKTKKQLAAFRAAESKKALNTATPGSAANTSNDAKGPVGSGVPAKDATSTKIQAIKAAAERTRDLRQPLYDEIGRLQSELTQITRHLAESNEVSVQASASEGNLTAQARPVLKEGEKSRLEARQEEIRARVNELSGQLKDFGTKPVASETPGAVPAKTTQATQSKGGDLSPTGGNSQAPKQSPVNSSQPAKSTSKRKLFITGHWSQLGDRLK